MNGMRELAAVKAALRQHEIELPSWAFGNTGTRFKVFGQPGVPRTPWEKADDAAQVHRFTGVAPSMAVHIPWDKVDDFAALARGSFLVSREAARAMRTQGLGGDIVYICSKNSVVAGPANVAYGAAKADQAHQVRLLAAELGGDGIRVNGINPDGVVRGSGIFAGGWGAQRAAVYGVAEEDLGAYYARRTLLKHEVLPEHVAAAVFALTAGDLSLTTGLHVPVDSGVAAGFLR
jgi:NAD(P)-dependent dehydrogenase (short-subunit alcohol dehydrogenase family)